MAGYIEAMHDRMWRWAYPEHADALDGVTRPNGPPVFKRGTATHNVPVPEDAAKARAILSTVPPGKRHLWFRSTKSSQALAQGVFGALIAYDASTRSRASRRSAGDPRSMQTPQAGRSRSSTR